VKVAGRLSIVALTLAAGPAAAWTPAALFAPCVADCAVTIYAGNYVEDSMTDLVTAPRPPTSWEYADGDRLVATAVSRVAGRFWQNWSVEPEIGLGQRYGREGATEVWGAVFFRYHGFPWDGTLLTTMAVSTGLNWASEVTAAEQDRARDDEGSQLMHFFSPEVTLALPSHPDIELLVRLHHRSGVFGLVSDAWGGAQYLSAGVRVRF
jgi:hypothetical protein